MPPEQVARIDALRERFAPTDPGKRYGWLFTHHPHLPDAKTSIDDYQGYEAELSARRVTVVREVAQAAGLVGVEAVAAVAELPQLVGNAVAAAGLVQDDGEDAFLQAHLANADGRKRLFAIGYVWERTRTRGRDWAEEKFRSASVGWTPEQRADLLLAIDCDQRAWERAAQAGEAVERAYWTRQQFYFVRDETEVEGAARKLLAFGRPFAALDLLGMHVGKKVTFDPALVTEVLEACLITPPGNDGHRSLFTHNVGQLLDYLADQSLVDEVRVGRLEWGFLPIISQYERVPKILHRALARDPALFVEIVSMIYRSKDEPKRDQESISDEERQRASRAYSLLRSWNRLPGTREDGSLDAVALRNWVTAARTALASGGRGEIGDQEIGQLLSHCPPDQDGTWPCRAVRDLIESVASDDLDQGLSVGLYNSRGVTTRNPAAGGVLERGLAERYAGLAVAVADESPRTASMLRRIADDYRADARREDHEAALGEDLGR
jgi:hypothetical protein